MPAQTPPRPPACPPPSRGSPRTPTPAHSPVLGVGTLDVLALLQVGLQVHLEEGWAAGVVRTPHRPVVTAALVVPVGGRASWAESPEAPVLSAPGRWEQGQGEDLLASTELDGEGAPSGVHLKDWGLSAPCCPAAVPAVDEELPDLLGHRNVVHHHRQLGVVHGALLCRGGHADPKVHLATPAPGNSAQSTVARLCWGRTLPW